MAHEFRNLASQSRETLTVLLVVALVSALFFAGLFLFFRWRDRHRRGTPPVHGFRHGKRRRSAGEGEEPVRSPCECPIGTSGPLASQGMQWWTVQGERAMLTTLSALDKAVTTMDVWCWPASASPVSGVARAGAGKSDRAGGRDAACAQHVGLPRIAIAVLAGGLLFLSPAQASGHVREPDCRMWLTANGPELKGWAVGYLSGMNLVWNAEHKAPAEPLSMLSSREEIFAWLTTYCRANAPQPLGRALIVLFFEQVKRKEGR